MPMLNNLLTLWTAVLLGVFAGSRVAELDARGRRSKWRFMLYPLPVCISVALGWLLVPKGTFEVYLAGLCGLCILFRMMSRA